MLVLFCQYYQTLKVSLFVIPIFCLCFSRSLNELRVLLLGAHRHSRDMEKDLHKAEWKVKEQKLQDDIKTLREKLLLLVRRKDFMILANAVSHYQFYFRSFPF